MKSDGCRTPDQVTSRSMDAPQNSIRKNAAARVYTPASKVSSRRAKLAAVNAAGPVQFYGTLASPSLLARKTLTFASFLREPQVRTWVLAQNDSDAVAMMDEILRENACDSSLKDTNAYLKLFCKRRAAEWPQPIRYWQRVKNSLLNPYLGVFAGHHWNSKAENGEVTRLTRKAAYGVRERDRLAARYSAEGNAPQLKLRILRLQRQANDLDLKAQAKAKKAGRILSAAKALTDEAEQKRTIAAGLSSNLKKLTKKFSAA